MSSTMTCLSSRQFLRLYKTERQDPHVPLCAACGGLRDVLPLGEIFGLVEGAIAPRLSTAALAR